MEITASNFISQLPYLQKSIDSADFISFDTEFSGKSFTKFTVQCIGYSVRLEDRGHDYDTLEERYQKLKYVCSSFLCF